MRTTRVYADLPLDLAEQVTLPAGPARHLTQVLRLAAGDPVTLFNGDGYDYPARLLATDRHGATVLIKERSGPEPIASLEIHLGLGISKGERMDYALQKAVELGVASLTPLFTERCQVRLDGERLERRLEHWRGIIVSACEQSGRRRLPTLASAVPLEPWLSRQGGTRLLLDPDARLALPELDAPTDATTLLVGPEGGLSQQERGQAERRGFQSVRLGPRILRTETAPLAAIAAIQALWGDFRSIQSAQTRG